MTELQQKTNDVGSLVFCIRYSLLPSVIDVLHGILKIQRINLKEVVMDQPPSKELLFISIIGAVLVIAWSLGSVENHSSSSFGVVVTVPSEISSEGLLMLTIAGFSWLK